MICSPDFIKVYNETFKFIAERLDYKGLCDYWKRISPIILADLQEAVEKHGLCGAFNYWGKTLSAEEAGYELYLDNGLLALDIHECPSMSSLKEPCKSYCNHCYVMYQPIFEPLGYEYLLKKKGRDSCSIRITKSKTGKDARLPLQNSAGRPAPSSST